MDPKYVEPIIDAAKDLLNDLDNRAYGSEPKPGLRNCMERLRTALYYPQGRVEREESPDVGVEE